MDLTNTLGEIKKSAVNAFWQANFNKSMDSFDGKCCKNFIDEAAVNKLSRLNKKIHVLEYLDLEQME